ncbi:hypothetical protein F5148DRAFT_968145, partial [Russula earlei]
WDDSNDKFQGMCQEHNQKLTLIFTSEWELDLLCDALQDGDVHLASKACVLSENPCEYSTCPIMILGTCKRKTGAQHANLIRTILTCC